MNKRELNSIKKLLAKAVKMQWYEMAGALRDARKLLEARLERKKSDKQ